MELFFYFCLFIFGILFGSFSSVIIYRLKSGESGILNGRSHCAKCNHILGAFELIPIFSWLKNIGKCKYCKKKISAIYPFLEISMGILFALVGYFLIDFNLIISGNLVEIGKLFFWLIIGFITIVYTFYDILFLEIHDGIMLFGIILIILAIFFQSFGIINFIDNLNILTEKKYLEINHSIGLLIISIIGFYMIMLKELKEIYDVLILIGIGIGIYLFNIFFTTSASLLEFPAISALVGAYGIFIFFFLQIIVSKGAWMGGGDLRIAIFIGLLLGSSLAFEGTFMTYIVGSFLGTGAIIFSKFKNGFKTTFNSQIPFGPFLAIGFFITIFYSESILNFTRIYF